MTSPQVQLRNHALTHAARNAEQAMAATLVVALVFPEHGDEGGLPAAIAIDGEHGQGQTLRDVIRAHCLDPSRFDVEPAELPTVLDRYADCMVASMLIEAWRAIRLGADNEGSMDCADAWYVPLGAHCVVVMAPISCVAQVGEERLAQLAHESMILRARSQGRQHDEEALRLYTRERQTYPQ